MDSKFFLFPSEFLGIVYANLPESYGVGSGYGFQSSNTQHLLTELIV